MEDKIVINFEISRKAMAHALDEVEDHTDVGTSSLPFPPSSEWCEFRNVLREAFDKATGNA